jgi:signal transduction histidine kinase
VKAVRTPGSLRARLVLGAAGPILAALALFVAATLLLVSDQLRGSLDRALLERARQVAQLAVSAPAVLSSPGALESPVSGRQIAVEVIDSRGRILARSLTLGARLLPQDALAREALSAGRTGYEDVSIAGRTFRLYAAPIADAGGPAAGGAVLVASDTTDISETIGHLALVLGVIGAAIALLAVAGAALLTRRGLRPLNRLAAAAGEIERTADPSRRLPEPHGEDEVAQLSGVLNRMLAALERAQAAERRFLADASHELRTPVTALLGNVEYAARHGTDPELLADLQRDAERLARLVDDLLVLERAAAPEPDLEPLALDELVRDLVLERAQADGRVRLGPVRAVTVRGEREALRRALANLLDNGLIHGPAQGAVTVEVGADAGWARVTVRDEGHGPPEAAHERLFERFWRGPEATGRPGSGLGLSIVAAVADRHHGRMTVDGSAFTLELPELRDGISRREPAVPHGSGDSARKDRG